MAALWSLRWPCSPQSSRAWPSWPTFWRRSWRPFWWARYRNYLFCCLLVAGKGLWPLYLCSKAFTINHIITLTICMFKSPQGNKATLLGQEHLKGLEITVKEPREETMLLFGKGNISHWSSLSSSHTNSPSLVALSMGFLTCKLRELV